MGHGYLFHEFLSENTNLRTDRYGGNPENRARVITEAIEAMKASLGRNFIVMPRLSGEGGYTIEEAKVFAQLFEVEVRRMWTVLLSVPLFAVRLTPLWP